RTRAPPWTRCARSWGCTIARHPNPSGPPLGSSTCRARGSMRTDRPPLPERYGPRPNAPVRGRDDARSQQTGALAFEVNGRAQGRLEQPLLGPDCVRMGSTGRVALFQGHKWAAAAAGGGSGRALPAAPWVTTALDGL